MASPPHPQPNLFAENSCCSPVIKALTAHQLFRTSPPTTSTTLGDFSKIFTYLHLDQASYANTTPSATFSGFAEASHQRSYSYQPSFLTESRSVSSPVYNLVPEYLERNITASTRSNMSKSTWATTARGKTTTSKPEIMSASINSWSGNVSVVGLPPSPPPSPIFDHPSHQSELAPPRDDFHVKGLPHGGSAILSGITTPSITPHACRATSPASPNGLDHVGERLLKKQFDRRHRVVVDESLAAHANQRFGSRDHWIQETFPQQCANGIHEFCDGSNITVSFYNALKKRRGMSKRDQLPAFFSLSAFRNVLERGRLVKRRFIAGSRNKMGVEPHYLLQARCLGFETKVFDRVPRYPTSSDSEEEQRGMQMREQGVDELVCLGMAESLLDMEPGIMILATGDGNVGEFSNGFPKFVKRALLLGWIVEVYSFAASAHSIWTDPPFLNNPKWNGRLSFHPLDSFLPDFIESVKGQLSHSAIPAAPSRSDSKNIKFSKTKTTNFLTDVSPTSNTIPRQTAVVA